jgi:hypothetical protein
MRGRGGSGSRDEFIESSAGRGIGASRTLRRTKRARPSPCADPASSARSERRLGRQRTK